jgi:DNA mismatch endonuclease, patch repair protein
MAAIRSKNTAPELIVRRLVHRLGYRFRLHVRRLPGTPDIVLPRHRKIIEVRGCFWHGHTCGRFRMPATRRRYWAAKFARNSERDRDSLRRLRKLGWRVLIVWECGVKSEANLQRRLLNFLSN